MANPVSPVSNPGKRASFVKSGRTVGNQYFLFDRSNWMWMGIGLVVIIIGFLLMAGGKSPDPNQFLYDEIYSARRITIAPILILIGFAIEAYAIMKKPATAVVVEDATVVPPAV